MISGGCVDVLRDVQPKVTRQGRPDAGPDPRIGDALHASGHLEGGHAREVDDPHLVAPLIEQVAHLCYCSAMRRAVTLRQVGGSVGATLPREMVDHLDLAPGDRVLAIETEQGILLTPYTDDLEADLSATRRAAKRYRRALRELAG